METSPLICGANQWTGFYMIMASNMKELNGHALLHDEKVSKGEGEFEVYSPICFLSYG